MRTTSAPTLRDPTATIGSTPNFFSLWDLDSDNSLGTYDTEEEAVSVMRLLIEANGSVYAPVLDLTRVDESGHQEHVGTGETLVPDFGTIRERRAY
jgi:hypothetical protein